MLLAIHLIVVCSFIVLGILFSKGKGAFLIAGYNTAPPREKAKTDEKKLCRFMGKFMFALAACWLVIAASALFDRMSLHWIGLGLFLAVIIAGLIYANTGNRFQR